MDVAAQPADPLAKVVVVESGAAHHGHAVNGVVAQHAAAAAQRIHAVQIAIGLDFGEGVDPHRDVGEAEIAIRGRRRRHPHRLGEIVGAAQDHRRAPDAGL